MAAGTAGIVTQTDLLVAVSRALLTVRGRLKPEPGGFSEQDGGTFSPCFRSPFDISSFQGEGP